MGPKTNFETQLEIMRLIADGICEQMEILASMEVALEDLNILLTSLVKNGQIEGDTYGFSECVYNLTKRGENVLNYHLKQHNDRIEAMPWQRFFNPFQDLQRLRTSKTKQ